MRALRAFDRWWMRPLGAQPIAFFRIAVGLFVLVYIGDRWPDLAATGGFESGQFEPVGVVTILGEPLGAWMVYALIVGTMAAAVAFTLGWRYAVTGPVFAILLLFLLTYRNSWGQVFHSENLLVLHVLVLSIAPAADSLSLDARRRAGIARTAISYGWPLQLCAVITVITYVIAGIAKLETSGLEWITSDALRNHVAYDNLRKELVGDYSALLGGWLVGHGWVFKPLAAATIIVELAAPIALLGRRFALVWAAGAWLFHIGVLVSMAILFPYQVVGLAFLPLFAWDGEPVVERVRRAGALVAAKLGYGEPAGQPGVLAVEPRQRGDD
jgi:hypothetical protein